MDVEKLADEHVTIADVVTADKVDAISSGIVIDDESRTLSVLAERQDALGVRPARKRGGRTAPAHAKKAASLKQAAGAAQELRAQGIRSAMVSEKTQGIRSATGAKEAQGVRLATAAEEAQASGDKALKVRQIAMREVVSELDDT
ncbi:hypothetical protein, partial [Adlercreutzia sp. ZJ141]|uniref:hypothetical protein n=1 Tax=Adlercreutzia sp. ZJ141 TaxID=2709406 RepID=UPI001981F0E3